MTARERSRKTLPKSVRLMPEEVDALQKISETELISEAALMRKFVLEGVRRYYVEQAIKRYEEGEFDLSSAAQVAGISIRELMQRLSRRGVDIYGPDSRLAEGLAVLREAFRERDAR